MSEKWRYGGDWFIRADNGSQINLNTSPGASYALRLQDDIRRAQAEIERLQAELERSKSRRKRGPSEDK